MHVVRKNLILTEYNKPLKLIVALLSVENIARLDNLAKKENLF